MAGDGVAVVPVAMDRAGLPVVARFYRDHGLDHLAMYLDPERRTAHFDADNPNDAVFALYGLPISYLVDREGRVRGYIPGAVDWDSAAAKDLIRYYIREPATGARSAAAVRSAPPPHDPAKPRDRS